MKRDSHAIPPADKGTFNLSISDLMSGLLAIFILALCYAMQNYGEKTAKLTSNNASRAELVQEIEESLMAKGIEVTVDADHGVLHIPDTTLGFDSGSAELKEKRHAKVIGRVLLETLTAEKFRGRVETVFVEGHTDSDPIRNGQFHSNWELSTQRAINTWNEMRGEGNEDLDYLRNIYYKDKEGREEDRREYIFSCSGYADTRPQKPNDTDANKEKNRRIDIRFSMVPPSKDELPVVTEVRKELAGGKNGRS